MPTLLQAQWRWGRHPQSNPTQGLAAIMPNLVHKRTIATAVLDGRHAGGIVIDSVTHTNPFARPAPAPAPARVIAAAIGATPGPLFPGHLLPGVGSQAPVRPRAFVNVSPTAATKRGLRSFGHALPGGLGARELPEGLEEIAPGPGQHLLKDRVIGVVGGRHVELCFLASQEYCRSVVRPGGLDVGGEVPEVELLALLAPFLRAPLGPHVRLPLLVAAAKIVQGDADLL
mmetsp:Transcript_2858/g.6937  ORF Transcript_2858/g.6937 Transcript_2858/m.6937 type:complete len:229 (+) Transcript_2858:697-1383(+)